MKNILKQKKQDAEISNLLHFEMGIKSDVVDNFLYHSDKKRQMLRFVRKFNKKNSRISALKEELEMLRECMVTFVYNFKPNKKK